MCFTHYLLFIVEQEEQEELIQVFPGKKHCASCRSSWRPGRRSGTARTWQHAPCQYKNRAMLHCAMRARPSCQRKNRAMLHCAMRARPGRLDICDGQSGGWEPLLGDPSCSARRGLCCTHNATCAKGTQFVIYFVSDTPVSPLRKHATGVISQTPGGTLLRGTQRHMLY